MNNIDIILAMFNCDSSHNRGFLASTSTSNLSVTSNSWVKGSHPKKLCIVTVLALATLAVLYSSLATSYVGPSKLFVAKIILTLSLTVLSPVCLLSFMNLSTKPNPPPKSNPQPSPRTTLPADPEEEQLNKALIQAADNRYRIINFSSSLTRVKDFADYYNNTPSNITPSKKISFSSGTKDPKTDPFPSYNEAQPTPSSWIAYKQK